MESSCQRVHVAAHRQLAGGCLGRCAELRDNKRLGVAARELEPIFQATVANDWPATIAQPGRCSEREPAVSLRVKSKRQGRLAYSYPRVIHRSEESPQELLPAASVNNSAAQKNLCMSVSKISYNRENTHRLATNWLARHSTPNGSPSSWAMRWSLTNTQWRTASISRSHYKPFARISQRVF